MTNLGVATAMINAARELTARAEAAEARVAELSKRGTRIGEKELGERCDRLQRERDEARARLLRAYSALDMCLHADESLTELRTVQAVIRDRSPSPQPTATHFACPQRHLDYEPQPESDDVCPDKDAQDAELEALKAIVSALERFDAIDSKRILDATSVLLGIREAGRWVDL